MGVRSTRSPAPRNLNPSEAVRWKLLETLFYETFSLLASGVACLAIPTFTWLLTGKSTIVWILLGALVLAVRVLLAVSFRVNRRLFGRRTWTGLFGCGGCAMAMAWGLAALPAYNQGQPAIELVVVGVQTAYVYGSACRNAACKSVAWAQILIISAIMIVTYLCRQDVYATIFAVAVALNSVPALLIVRQLHHQLLLSLCADEELGTMVSATKYANEKLAAANARLITMSCTDELTSIANRRRLDEVLLTEWHRAERANAPISLYIADIDWFKRYNDTLGHQAGDECLRRVAYSLAHVLCRSGDIVGRYGGEEFVAILPATDAAGAAHIAERARAGIAELNLAHGASEFGNVTISIGVVTLAAHPPARAEDLVRLADEALYRAKECGRNRVCAARTDVPSQYVRDAAG